MNGMELNGVCFEGREVMGDNGNWQQITKKYDQQRSKAKVSTSPKRDPS
jgi:hypothetical protein